LWQLLLSQKLSTLNLYCFNYFYHSQDISSLFLILLAFTKYLDRGSMNLWNCIVGYLMIFAYILRRLWSPKVRGSKTLIDFKCIWLIHSEGQVQKVFTTLDRLGETNHLECLIMAQHLKIKSVMEVTRRQKYSWIK
jgi:hypothetical protein